MLTSVPVVEHCDRCVQRYSFLTSCSCANCSECETRLYFGEILTCDLSFESLSSHCRRDASSFQLRAVVEQPPLPVSFFPLSLISFWLPLLASLFAAPLPLLLSSKLLPLLRAVFWPSLVSHFVQASNSCFFRIIFQFFCSSMSCFFRTASFFSNIFALPFLVSFG